MKMVVTLVTHPKKENLTPAEIAAVKSQLSNVGATITGDKWLCPNVACDIYFEGIDQNQANDILTATTARFDIAVQAVNGRLKKLLLADMDSTMITIESLDTLADELGFGAEVRDITERGMRGELDFEASLRTRVGLLKGKPASALNLVLDQIDYMPGAEIAVKTLVAHGVYTALVSGGFMFTTEVAYKKLGFHEHHANDLLIENGKLTGFVGEPILGPNAKLENLKRLCAEKQIALIDTCTIGDGANDIPMLKSAGLGVAYYGKPIVRENAAFKIEHSDLTALLYYQGIAHEEFVQI